MAEKKEKSFEENLANLEEIVKKLESGDVSLDEAMEKFNEAMKLAKQCDDKLKNAEKALTKIVTENGSLEDFEIDS